MDNVTKHSLQEEIRYELGNLSGTDFGSEEYKTKVDTSAKLIDRWIELEKMDADAEQRRLDRESNERLKQKQLANERTDRLISNGIAIAGIIIPTLVTIWGTVVSLKFEETGSVTTIMGRGFINKLLPRK